MKKELGQFYTVNYKYILENFKIPEHVENIIEPFAGKGDLIDYVGNDYNVEAYDIEPKKENIVEKDTLLNPPDYKNKFVITNPPFLARNKSENKEIFDKYNLNDLYKCFIKNIIDDVVLGGIIILPLNFWSSIRKHDIELRSKFLKIYEIIHMNIFEERVFPDTSYTVCSLQFKYNINSKSEISCSIYPEKKDLLLLLNEDNNYTFGGEIYNLPQKTTVNIGRLTLKNKDDPNITNLLVKCIDTNENKKIEMSLVKDDVRYIDDTPNQSARTYATLIIEPKLTIKQQKKLVDKFNTYLNNLREKYNSLFLTNYRESKKIARKRISFNLVFSIVNYLLDDL